MKTIKYTVTLTIESEIEDSVDSQTFIREAVEWIQFLLNDSPTDKVVKAETKMLE